jgi:hypothetical protein
MASHVEKNRRDWDLSSDVYQAAHGTNLLRTALAWGVWRVPESELQILGDLRGLEVLELGCGAAQWTLALLDAGIQARGAHQVGEEPRPTFSIEKPLDPR